MFKSSFSKYLTAFVVIIFLSFLILSGIISSVIRTQITADKVTKLELSTSVITKYYEDKQIEELERFILYGGGSSVVTMFPLVNIDYEFQVLVTDSSGVILLSTANADAIGGDFGSVSISQFESKVGNDGTDYLYYNGVIESVSEEPWLAYAKPVVTKGAVRGYVITIASSVKEDRLIGIMRTTVFHSSLWVMLAAVIAAYFITERIVYPLKNMTNAAKKFGKGDFTERITVYGHDEVSELAVAFNNMAESLDSLEKMRNTFLANVSHDLRTPMTTIAGFIEGITSGAIPPDQHNHYLGIISSEVHRLSRLVSQLLDLSRYESGDRKLSFTDFDVAEVARLVIISFEKTLDEKMLNVEFESEDSVYVHADKDAVYQVIYNLCHNAIKFSKEGGTFRVAIEHIGSKKIRFSVYDEGQTVSEEDALHIFDRFYKTDKSRGLDKSGVGLGLYICKTVIDGHGEEIEMVPHSDGCEFRFTLKEGDSGSKHKSVAPLED